MGTNFNVPMCGFLVLETMLQRQSQTPHSLREVLASKEATGSVHTYNSSKTS